MKAGVTAIAIDNSVFILAVSAEANFAIGLKQLFQLLDAREPCPLLTLATHFLDAGDFQGLIQHIFSLIAVAFFEVE